MKSIYSEMFEEIFKGTLYQDEKIVEEEHTEIIE